MKGFPNQVAGLGKLAVAMRCIVRLVDGGYDARDDGILGEDLVRAGVAGRGHTPRPLEAYIREQLLKPLRRQSFRTTARGLRELFKLLGFVTIADGAIRVTELGRQAAEYADRELGAEQIVFWRRVISEMTHDGGDSTSSHPYQVLLHLVQRKPEITRAKCALALEAHDDSPAELERIVGLADLEEDEIRRRIAVSKSNWDNAKKVLPKFAEQLGDVIRTRRSYRLADAPGRADADIADGGAAANAGAAGAATGARWNAPRAPRTSRSVTPDTIARAGAVEGFDEFPVPPAVEPAVAVEAARLRRDRLRRHNAIVRLLASRLAAHDAALFEDPFDVLAIIAEVGFLAEIKTLDGTPEDQRDRVKEALAQLLYYDAFVRPPDTGAVPIRKIACFERAISDAHANWLNLHGIAVIWRDADGFAGDDLAAEFIGQYIEELRR